MDELRSSKAVTLFITMAVNFAIERSLDERVKIGRLLVHLVSSKRTTIDQLVAGYVLHTYAPLALLCSVNQPTVIVLK